MTGGCFVVSAVFAAFPTAFLVILDTRGGRGMGWGGGGKMEEESVLTVKHLSVFFKELKGEGCW